MKNAKGRVLWTYIPMIVILFAAAILITWQITYNHTTKTMKKNYDKVLASITTENDMSHMMYNIDGILRAKYIGEIDNEKLMDYTIMGYIYGLGDKYASYMNKEDYAEYMLESSEGVKTGIGVTVVYDNTVGGLYVLSTYENSPAFLAGIVPGDIIIGVNGESVIDLGYSMAVEKITDGDIGTTVELTVSDESGNRRNLTLTRDEIQVDTVTGRIVNSDVGIIRISEFSLTTPEEFIKTIESLYQKGAQKFVFDVRNNPGGNLDGITRVLDFLLPEGDIIIINNKNGTQETIKSDATQFSAPMAVLVNGNTASAAELFTAALRDYDKAEIIGETTYGKGSMQEMIGLPNGGVASISVSTYLPPSGVDYNEKGIVPDHEVALPEDVARNFYRMTDAEDIQLQKALEILANVENTEFQ